MAIQPGRLSTLELELAERSKTRLALEQTLSEAKTQLAQLKAQQAKGIDPQLLREAEREPRLESYLREVDSIDLTIAEYEDNASAEVAKLSRRKSVLQKKLEQRRAQLVAELDAARTAELELKIKTMQDCLTQLDREIGQGKQDLGDLTYQMTQYLVAIEEEKQTRELLRRVANAEYRYEFFGDRAADDPEWAEIERRIFGPEREEK